MRLTPDTNVLVRALIGDDPEQTRVARATLQAAELVALTLPALCEVVWVLSRHYRIAHPDIAASLRVLMNGANVEADRSAVEVGLTALDAGDDFADAVIAHEGAWLGGDFFVSFDKLAVRLVAAQGGSAQLLA